VEFATTTPDRLLLSERKLARLYLENYYKHAYILSGVVDSDFLRLSEKDILSLRSDDLGKVGLATILRCLPSQKCELHFCSRLELCRDRWEENLRAALLFYFYPCF